MGFDDEAEEIAAPAAVAVDATDRSIERHFETGRLRVVQERSELFLPHVVDFIERDRWGNLRPEYQRRLRWDDTKKSRLIESFIMNVPVPPVFLYEVNLGSYEVMDGQQRLNAIVDFLQGRFELTGLKIWPGLNGRTFARLPPMVRRGLERAKVSSITLMSDSSASEGDDMDLRAQVFERLNTGGERLNPQELRNSLFSGPFNRLLVELATLPEFTSAWDIPSHQEHTRSDGTPDEVLRENNLFKRMLDVEIVLRFFAFRDDELISGSVRSMLDGTMKSLRGSDGAAIATLRAEFVDALATARSVFGDAVFRLPPAEGRARGVLSRPFYDAEMVAIHRLSHRRDEMLANGGEIANAVLALASPGSDKYDLMVGRGNTAALIKDRISIVQDTILSKL
ncbi:MAG: DUF262 domain-containing protein [Parvibaculaceae bacterium]